MTPDSVRTLRRDALLVQDRFHNALKVDTERNRIQFAQVEKWFSEKYPRYDWRQWSEENKRDVNGRS